MMVAWKLPCGREYSFPRRRVLHRWSFRWRRGGRRLSVNCWSDCSISDRTGGETSSSLLLLPPAAAGELSRSFLLLLLLLLLCPLLLLVAKQRKYIIDSLLSNQTRNHLERISTNFRMNCCKCRKNSKRQQNLEPSSKDFRRNFRKIPDIFETNFENISSILRNEFWKHFLNSTKRF